MSYLPFLTARVYEDATETRAQSFEVPLFGGGPPSAPDTPAHAPATEMSQTMREGEDYLKKLRSKKAVFRKVRPDVYNGMLLCFVDSQSVRLGFTIDPIPGCESRRVLPLLFDRNANESIQSAEKESSSRNAERTRTIARTSMQHFVRQDSCH